MTRTQRHLVTMQAGVTVCVAALLSALLGGGEAQAAAGELLVLPSNGRDLALYSTDGESVKDYPLAPPSFDVVAAPDGRTMALPSTEGLFLLDVDTGGVRALRPGPRVTAAAWRPDGNALAFEESDTVMIIDVATGASRVLVTTGQISVGAGGPCGAKPADSVSPYGWTAVADEVIAVAVGFCTERGQPLLELISVDPDDGAVRHLSDGAEALGPEVEPGGDRIAFADDREIVVIDASGARVAWLGLGSLPTWSPAGNELAWASNGRVFVSTLEGPAREIPGPWPDEQPTVSWSPDRGQLLVETSQQQWIVDLASGDRREISLGQDILGRVWLRPGPVVVRSAGSERTATAAAVAARWFPQPNGHAVIARADDYADALAAASLSDGGPVLLSDRDRLSDAAAAQLDRLQPQVVTLMGGEAALSSQVEQDVEARGFSSRRVAGSDRYETAAAAGDLLPDSDLALLASGQGFPDALALAPLAASNGAPLLLAAKDTLPEATEAALRDGGFRQVLAAGGPAVISDAALAAAAAACDCQVKRLAGPERTATAVLVAEELEAMGWVLDGAFLAPGDRFPDALAAGPAAGSVRRPLLLAANRDTLGETTRSWLEEAGEAIDRIDVVGDETVLSRAVAEEALAAASGS